MIRNTLILVFTLLLSSQLIAEETIVQGKIKGFDSKTIKIGVFSDYITNEKKWLDEQVIENGSFKLSIDLNTINQVVLKIEDKETSLFAEVGQVYNVTLSFDEEANRGQAFDKFLNLSFPFPKVTELNQQIKTFNKAYQDFFELNYAKMMYKGASKETQAFLAQWRTKGEKGNNDFLKNYIKYALANLEDISGGNNISLENTFIKGLPILYRHKEYMNFFTQFYQEDFDQLTLTGKSKKMRQALMFDESLDRTLEELNILKGFESAELSEFYLLYGLFEVYHKKVINQESSKKILQQITENGQTPENKEIASNILKALERYGKSMEAKEFTLLDDKGKEHSLSDYRGKQVYLSFWSNTSIPSLRELKVMQKLQAEYGDKVHFVSINLDDDQSINQSVVAKNDYAWEFLHFGGDYELREAYQVTTVPTYFLINEQGGISKAFAEGPIEMERTFFNTLK
jgi:peroxiredoxin